MRSAFLLLAAALLPACSPTLPGSPNPFDPLVFAPSHEATVTYAAPCLAAGATAVLTGTGMPAGDLVEIWVGGQGAGGWKIGNPPHPSAYGATRLGTSTVTSDGRLTFDVVLSADDRMRLAEGPDPMLEIWLVYPQKDGKTPIRPSAAAFPVCP